MTPKIKWYFYEKAGGNCLVLLINDAVLYVHQHV